VAPARLARERGHDAVLGAYSTPALRALFVHRALPDEAEGAFLARRKPGERRDLEQIEAILPEMPWVLLPLPEEV
jgi:hypothetical protein